MSFTTTMQKHDGTQSPRCPLPGAVVEGVRLCMALVSRALQVHAFGLGAGLRSRLISKEFLVAADGSRHYSLAHGTGRAEAQVEAPGLWIRRAVGGSRVFIDHAVYA